MKRSRFLVCATLANFIPFATSAQVSENDALGALISKMQKAGYSEINIIPRILSGYVVEAEKDDVAVLLSLDAETLQIIYAEAFEGRSETGFFASPQRPQGTEVSALVASYNLAIQGGVTDATGIDPREFMLSREGQRTAGFFQQNNISVDGSGSAHIYSVETLGILAGVATTSSTETTAGSRVKNDTVDSYSLNTEKIERTVIFEDGSRFSGDIFTDREAFVDGINLSISPSPAVPNTSQADVIEKIISNGGEDFGNLMIQITEGDVANKITVGDAINRTLQGQRESEHQPQQ